MKWGYKNTILVDYKIDPDYIYQVEVDIYLSVSPHMDFVLYTQWTVGLTTAKSCLTIVFEL